MVAVGNSVMTASYFETGTHNEMILKTLKTQKVRLTFNEDALGVPSTHRYNT